MCSGGTPRLDRIHEGGVASSGVGELGGGVPIRGRRGAGAGSTSMSCIILYACSLSFAICSSSSVSQFSGESFFGNPSHLTQYVVTPCPLVLEVIIFSTVKLLSSSDKDGDGGVGGFFFFTDFFGFFFGVDLVDRVCPSPAMLKGYPGPDSVGEALSS